MAETEYPVTPHQQRATIGLKGAENKPRPIFRTSVSEAREEVFGIKRQPSGSGANTWANSCAGVGNRN
jgi:hypothetical protein